MELPQACKLYLMTRPEHSSKGLEYGLTAAHLAYRVGNGPHLFRTQSPVIPRYGVMVVDNGGFDGQGDPGTFCQELLRECAARSFSGVFFDLEGLPSPALKRALELLAPAFQRRRWTLYVPEPYALPSPAAKVVISTALSGGSLRQRLRDAAAAYGPERIALGLEWVAEDFALPALDGAGTHLDREELERLLAERAPAVYFNHDLCAHYFTYMNTGQSAHFILYDDASSMAKKLHIAAELSIREAFLPDPQSDSLLRTLLS